MPQPRNPSKKRRLAPWEFFDKSNRIRTFSKRVAENPEEKMRIIENVKRFVDEKKSEKRNKKESKFPPPKAMTPEQIEKILINAGFRKISPHSFHHPQHGGITFNYKSEIRDPRLISKVWKLRITQ